MSLAKLTSISTKTLSLLLERQRMQTLPPLSAPQSNPLEADASTPNPNTSLHLAQITKNLAQLRNGIKEMEAKGGAGEAAQLLRNQYERMRNMLGEDASSIPSLEEATPTPSRILSPSPSSISASSYATAATGATSSTATPRATSPASPIREPMPSLGLTASRTKPDSSAAARSLFSNHTRHDSDSVFAPYTDDPVGSRPSSAPSVTPEADNETGILLQTQRFMMDEQDQRLDELSHSINRQHHISVQINDELDVHQGLLEELDDGVDRTHGRLGTARRKLDKVAKGIKENSSVFAIGVLIFVLLILIIVLKT